jgi:hypothetical protein
MYLVYLLTCFIFVDDDVVVWEYWRLNSGLALGKQALYHLSHNPFPPVLFAFFSLLFR